MDLSRPLTSKAMERAVWSFRRRLGQLSWIVGIAAVLAAIVIVDSHYRAAGGWNQTTATPAVAATTLSKPVNHVEAKPASSVEAQRATAGDDLYLHSVGMSQSRYEVYRIRQVIRDPHDVTLVLEGPKRSWLYRVVVPLDHIVHVKKRNPSYLR